MPIVNFWFPFQVVRDALPPAHPARREVPWWWGLHITALVAGFAAGLFAIAGVVPGVAVGVVAAAAALGAGYYGHELATAIGSAHEQLASAGRAAPGAPL